MPAAFMTTMKSAILTCSHGHYERSPLRTDHQRSDSGANMFLVDMRPVPEPGSSQSSHYLGTVLFFLPL